MSDELGQSVMTAAEDIEKSLGAPPPDPSAALCPEGEEPLVHQLVYSMLLWESSHEAAGKSLDAIRSELTSYNELRVCSGDEIGAMLARDAKRDERAARLSAALNDIFEKHHGLTLNGVAAMPKREARQALDAVAGMPGFVAARMMLVTLGGHAFPLDERLKRTLKSVGVEPAAGESLAEFAARLERAVRAADAPRVYGLLELQTLNGDARPAKSGGRKKPARSAKPKAGQDA